MDDGDRRTVPPDVRAGVQSLASAPIEWELPGVVPREVVDFALEIIRGRDYLHGVIVPGDTPLCVFRCANGNAADLLASCFHRRKPPNESIKLFPWLWDVSRFGSVFSLTVQVANAPWHAKVAVVAEPHIQRQIQAGRFRCLFVHRGRPVAVISVNFRASEKLSNLYEKLFLSAISARASIWCDFPEVALLNFVSDMLNEESERSEGGQARHVSSADRLSMSWARRFDLSVGVFEEMIRRIRESDTSVSAALRESMGWPGCIGDVVEGSLSPSDFFRASVSEFTRAPVECSKNLVRAIGALNSAEFGGCAHALLWLRGLLFISPEATRSGHCIAWVAAGEKLERLELDAKSLAEKCDVSTFWERVGAQPCFGLGDVIAASDVPADLFSDSAVWETFPRVESVDDAESAIEALLEEAQTSKQWTAPNGATVLLPVGPFSHVEIFERPDVVLFVFRTDAGEYSLLALWPQSGATEWSHFLSRQMSGEDVRKMFAAVRLLLVSIIRDFWVIEERERAFAAVRRALPHATQRPDEPVGPRIVYLPRIRYSAEPNLKRCEVELNQVERRAHFVRAHARRVGTSSEHQRILARMYGFDLSVGYTFVRPHQRGHLARDVVYRSRSAMQSLYSAEPMAPSDEVYPEWFAFERDVKRLMERLGFDVQHTSASRSGDGGVDLYATKGSDLDALNWIIQCKCFSPRRSVGVAIVREVMGALTPHPHGTRAMIVTTSQYTSEAVELAASQNIRLVDGVEFLSLTESRAK